MRAQYVHKYERKARHNRCAAVRREGVNNEQAKIMFEKTIFRVRKYLR